MATNSIETSTSKWRTVFDKMRKWLAAGMFVVIIILAVVGAGSVLSSQLKGTGTYDDSSILVAEAEDGTLYFVSRDSIAASGEGLVTGKVIIGLDPDSTLYFAKMLQAKLCGKDPYDVWGIEQDTQFDFVKRRYRIVASRVVDYKGQTLVYCTDIDTEWTIMFGKPTPFRSVIDKIKQWQKEKEKS